MGDVRKKEDGNGPLKVIACGNPNSERQFVAARHVLCISPVLKGYLEDPDTKPPGIKRNGEGTISLNAEGEVVHAILQYLAGKDTLQSSDHEVEFLVKLYKLALSLGLNDLCASTLGILQEKTRKVAEFMKASLEASKWGLINEKKFRHWFTSYLHRRQDEMLEFLQGNHKEVLFCRILVSALALVHDSPSTPSSSVPRRRQEGANLAQQRRDYSQSPSERTIDSSAKKRKLNAFVEDASPAEEDS